MFADLKRILPETCVLIALGCLFGLTINHQLVLDAFSGRLTAQPSAIAEESGLAALPMPAMLDEVRQLVASGGIVVDARSPDLYTLGHISGAVSLPMAEIEVSLPDFVQQVAKERTIVTYCSGFGCPDSFDLGVLLLEAGYRDVRVFEGGFPEWRDAGLPVGGGEQ